MDQAVIPGWGGCARQVLEVEGDFRDQKGRLQEVLTCRVIFYLEFHHVLNSIEHYWRRAKWKNCGHGFEALKAMVPEEFYFVGMQYGAAEFENCI